MSLVALDQRRAATTCSWRGSTPIRASRPPSCCCRNACRAKRSCPSRGRPKARPCGAGCRCSPSRRFRSPHTTSPHTHFLSNGRYTAALTHAGGGFSTWRGLVGHPAARGPDVGRRRATSSTCAIRGRAASGRRPTCRSGREPDDYEATFELDKVTFRRRDGDFETQLQIAVSPEDDVEVRRLSITNRGDRPREIEVTSYAEIVLARPEDDLAHPAFGKLFIETEYDAQSAGLLFSRRPRALGRTACLGLPRARRRRPARRRRRVGNRPRAVPRTRTIAGQPGRRSTGGALSGTTGAVLDPVAVAARARSAGAWARSCA